MPTCGPKDIGSYPVVQIGTRHLQNWQNINLFLPQYRNLHCRQIWTCRVRRMRVNVDEVYTSNKQSLNCLLLNGYWQKHSHKLKDKWPPLPQYSVATNNKGQSLLGKKTIHKTYSVISLEHFLLAIHPLYFLSSSSSLVEFIRSALSYEM